MITLNSTFAASLPATSNGDTRGNGDTSKMRGLLRIGDIAERFSLSLTTIRRATATGELPCYTLPSGHRRFALQSVLEWLGQEPEGTKDCGDNEHGDNVPVAMIVRVSSDGQARKDGNSDKSSYQHQQERVENYCLERFGKLGTKYYRVASGLNFDDRTFVKLCEDVLSSKFRGGYVIATDPTRIARFGVTMFQKLCEHGGCELVYTMDDRESQTENESLVSDVLSVLTHFTAKASGAKAAKVLKVNMPGELLKEAYALLEQGWTLKDIAGEFTRRGLKTEKGKDYTAHIVKTCVEENREILEATRETIGPNSFEQFVAENIEPARGRIDRKEVETRYREWCEENRVYAINPVKLAGIIDEQGWTRKLNKHKSVCYAGIGWVA